MKPFLILCLLIGTLSPSILLASDAEILSLARDVISKVRYGALISIGEEGQPRSRIVDAFPPDDGFVIFVATNPNTRKVKQIRDNPRVSLFYFDPESRSYVTVMGLATLVEENKIKLAMRRASDSDRIYPNFPDDYLLIKVVPSAVEGLLPGYRGDKDTWMPARVEF